MKKRQPPIRFSGGLFFYFFSLASTWSRATKERKKAPRGIVRLLLRYTAKTMLNLCGVLSLATTSTYNVVQVEVVTTKNDVSFPFNF